MRFCAAAGCQLATLAYPGSVKCFMKDFTTWYEAQQGSSTALPTGSAFITELASFRGNFTGTMFDAPYDYKDVIGIVDGQVKFVSIPFSTTLQSLRPYAETKSVYDVTEAMIDSIVATMPAGLRSTLDVSGMGDYGRTWDFLTIQEALVEGLFTGFAICFPTSFLVLLFATRNVITALYAIFTIAAICASVLGYVHGAYGYALGIVETIGAVCVIGFSVDYTVHLAHMYHECSLPTSVERAAFAAVHMGATVFGGAVTTLGAGMVLLLCILTFFNKMGTIMCVTIFFSYMYAMFFFMPLLFVLGPTGRWGSIRYSDWFPTSTAAVVPAAAEATVHASDAPPLQGATPKAVLP